MLVGRKNSTFVEPQGFLARLLHTFIPKLLFMPYPIRNMAQKLFAAWVQTITALVAYGFVAFVSIAGFAGEIGELTFPIYSTLLMLYLLVAWRKAGQPIARNAEKNISSLGTSNLVKVIAFSLLLPVVIGAILSWVMASADLTHKEINAWLTNLPSLNTELYFIALFILAITCTAVIMFMLRKRLAHANPTVEVSELRENWQESVHPNEIFINLDNLVMANRRYKEVPNRVYKELDPQLEEQIDGKGGFKGELLQEIQPKVKPMDLGASFDTARLIALISGNMLFILSVIITFLLAYSVVDIYQFIKTSGVNSVNDVFNEELFSGFSNLVMSAFQIFLVGYLIRSFALLMTNVAHLFFAEIQFESLLVYFKCEGTFTESKIATGTGIHDSTRSENTLVRSSITPWIITSSVVSTTFADTGMKNLEHPRTILEMHKNDKELASIKDDVISFLKDRESIASITSARDLGNASQIHQLNQQTRAMPMQNQIEQDDEAAGYLRQEQDIADDKKSS